MGQFRARRLFAFATIAAISALTACGGGGGSSTAPAAHSTPAPLTTTPATSSGSLAPASFAIKIPGTGTSGVSRRVLAVSAQTQSAVFTLLKTDNTDPTALPSPNPTQPF